MKKVYLQSKFFEKLVLLAALLFALFIVCSALT
jgi:hypothetical protein